MGLLPTTITETDHAIKNAITTVTKNAATIAEESAITIATDIKSPQITAIDLPKTTTVDDNTTPTTAPLASGVIDHQATNMTASQPFPGA
jgi:hypothetical protein